MFNIRGGLITVAKELRDWQGWEVIFIGKYSLPKEISPDGPSGRGGSWSGSVLWEEAHLTLGGELIEEAKEGRP